MKCKPAYAWTFDKGSMGMGCNFIVASLVYGAIQVLRNADGGGV